MLHPQRLAGAFREYVTDGGILGGQGFDQIAVGGPVERQPVIADIVDGMTGPPTLPTNGVDGGGVRIDAVFQPRPDGDTTALAELTVPRENDIHGQVPGVGFGTGFRLPRGRLIVFNGLEDAGEFFVQIRHVGLDGFPAIDGDQGLEFAQFEFGVLVAARLVKAQHGAPVFEFGRQVQVHNRQFAPIPLGVTDFHAPMPPDDFVIPGVHDNGFIEEPVLGEGSGDGLLLMGPTHLRVFRVEFEQQVRHVHPRIRCDFKGDFGQLGHSPLHFITNRIFYL